MLSREDSTSFMPTLLKLILKGNAVCLFDARIVLIYNRHYIDLTLDGIFHRPEQRIDIKMVLASKNRGRISRK